MLRIAKLRLNLKNGKFQEEAVWRKAIKTLIGGRTSFSQYKARLQPNPEKIIWKDPFAMFCMDEILKHPDIRIVVCFRSAAELAASLKRVKWGYSHFDIKDKIHEKYHIKTSGVYRDTHLSFAHRGALF